MPQNAQKHKPSNDNSKIKIDPTERIDFILALSIDDRLSDCDPKVASILLSFRNNKSGTCNPSHHSIADRANMTVIKVRRSLKRLAKTGWIKIIKQSSGNDGLQTSNQYHMNFEAACSAVKKLYERKVPAAPAGGTGSSRRSACSPVITLPDHQRSPRLITSDHPGCSPVSNEPREVNSEVEPGHSNPEKDSRFASHQRNASGSLRDENGASPLPGHQKQEEVNHSPSRKQKPIDQFLDIYPDDWTTGENIEGRKQNYQGREEDIRIAEIKLNQALKRGIPLNTILAGVRLFADCHAKKGTDPEYISNPVTWIVDEHWDDEYDDDAQAA